jgi:hypothetical protein
LSETGSRVVANCPNPGCGAPIRENHPYSWCSKCGERLPDSIQHQLTKLRELDAKAQSTREGLARSNSEIEAVPLSRVEAVARLYRHLVLLVGVQIILGLLRGFLQGPSDVSPTPGEVNPLTPVIALIGLVVFVWTAITAYKLTEQLGEKLPILWAILMFVPCLNIIGLLILSSKAQAWCHQYGIKVGLFGPSKESIEELRQRGSE